MYEKMYCILFNAITDRLRENQNMNFGRAAFLLEEAQRQAEAVYLESAEEKTKSAPMEKRPELPPREGRSCWKRPVDVSGRYHS